MVFLLIFLLSYFFFSKKGNRLLKYTDRSLRYSIVKTSTIFGTLFSFTLILIALLLYLKIEPIMFNLSFIIWILISIFLILKLIIPVDKDLNFRDYRLSEDINIYMSGRISVYNYILLMLFFIVYVFIFPVDDPLNIFIIILIFLFAIASSMNNLFSPKAIIGKEFLLYRANLFCNKIIPLESIVKIQLLRKFNIERVLITYKGPDSGSESSIISLKNKEEFIRDILRRNESINLE